MSDLIKREDAIAAVWKPQVKPNELIFDALKTAIESEINNIPSADTAKPIDMSACYSAGYESGYKQGKADRPQGEWIHNPNGIDRDFIWWKCSECGHVIYSESEHDREEFHAFCGRCGARMKDVTEGLESRTDLIWYGDKTDLIGDETGRHTGWFGKGADDE